MGPPVIESSLSLTVRVFCKRWAGFLTADAPGSQHRALLPAIAGFWLHVPIRDSPSYLLPTLWPKECYPQLLWGLGDVRFMALGDRAHAPSWDQWYHAPFFCGNTHLREDPGISCAAGL